MFTPISRNLTNITTAPASQNFSAAQVFAVSGRVTSNGAGVTGVRVSFSNNGNVFATTDNTGNYTLNLLKGWTGTITPTLTGRVFTPVSVAVTVPLAANLIQNFSTTQTIAGTASIRVGAANVGVAGVTITLSTGGTVTTAANGTFRVTVPTGWTGTLTASGGGRTWNNTFIYTATVPTPAGQFPPVTANIVGIRFNGV